MREILFRAKTASTNNPEWVKGYYGFDSKTHWIDRISEEYPGHTESIPINPETLGQFTGLTDSKGVKVFEGDILSFTCQGEKWRGYITFGNPHRQYSWGWEIVEITLSEVSTDILLWFDMEEVGAYSEVIGNIYDNPELLEEAQNDA